MQEEERKRVYAGPYILALVNGEYRFMPARHDERHGWVVMTPEEYEEAKRAAE